MIERHPDFGEYIGPNSRLVKYPHFESALCKLQSARENELTIAEANAICHLKIPAIPNELQENAISDHVEEDPAEIILREANKFSRKDPALTESSYRPVHHILATSNIVERLFSIAKLIKCDNRKRMLAENLDRVLFLRYNSNRWGSQTVQACLDLQSPEEEVEEEDYYEAPEEANDEEPLIERFEDEEEQEESEEVLVENNCDH